MKESSPTRRSCTPVLQTWPCQWWVSPCSDQLLKGLQLISGTNHAARCASPATALQRQPALGEHLSQGSHKQRGCSSKANPFKLFESSGWGRGDTQVWGFPSHSTPWGPPVTLSLSVPVGPATMAKDRAEAPHLGSPRGTAGPGTAGPGPPAPITRPVPPPATSIVPPRPSAGGGCPPAQGTSPQ